MSIGVVYDVVVVGAGLAGVSIAYQLSRRGASVLVIDQRGLAGGASGANAGLVLWSGTEKGLSTELAREGFRRMRHLNEELDADLEYRDAFGLYLATTEEEERLFLADSERLRQAGFRSRVVGPDEVGRYEPRLHVGGEVRSAWLTEEGALNPFRLVFAYWRQAHRHGARLAAGITVHGFSVAGDVIRGVLTSAGEIAAGEVVLAAGAWTRALAAKLGLDLPEYYAQGEAVVTEPVPPLLQGFVCQGDLVRVVGEKRAGREAMERGWEGNDAYSFRAFGLWVVQTARGNLVLAQMTYIHPRLSDQVSRAVFRHAAHETLRVLPVLSRTALLRGWRSPVPFTPDHLPFLGRVGGWRNLTIASGFKSTIIITPVVGELVAQLIVDGQSSVDLSPFDPLRFSFAKGGSFHEA